MIVPSKVQIWLEENGFGDVKRASRVGGGCINNGAVVYTDTKTSFFLKTNKNAPEKMFECEAIGLAELNVDGGPRVPEVYHLGEDFILMEFIPSEDRSDAFWQDFGTQLAVLHGHQAEQHGFHQDNYIGSSPQINSWTENGHEFFRERRLMFQARMARSKGYLNSRHIKTLEILVENLEDLVPDQPASLLHGDLWSGNAIVDDTGSPAIIDPAVYYGWAEAELAMTTLFGSFPREFYHSYVETRPLEQGYRERFPIYNLYHLLNHLNLFGSSYLPQILSILNRYS